MLVDRVDWFRHATIYHALIDRFAGCAMPHCDGPVFAGGNLRGLRDRLSYIADLGCDVLWISPFLQSESYHGYDVTDYFAVNDRFGTVEDLSALIEACHAQGLRIIADFVPNHCSAAHPFFVEARRDPGSAYRQWFRFDGRRESYATFLGHRDLPQLNLRHPATRTHVIDAARHWLQVGVDGYRLDHVIGPPPGFWTEFRVAVKGDFPDAVLIGEALLFAIPWRHIGALGLPARRRLWLANRLLQRDMIEPAIRRYVDLLDGCIDFTFQGILLEALRAPVDRATAASLARSRLRRHYARFPRTFLLPSLVDGHDCNRFAWEFRGTEYRANLEVALQLQLEQDQPAIIYYGTEIGMAQEQGLEAIHIVGDNLARQPMIWDPAQQDLDVHALARRLIRERRCRRP